jgi:hypothetical protein
MFLRYYLVLEVPYGEVHHVLVERADTWVPGLLLEAEDRGQRLLAEVGFSVDTRRIDREVEIRLGEPYRIPTKTVLPMTWRATRSERLFPELDADIELAAMGPSRTQLSISARYRPPMAILGRVVDRALLHRVAEATIKDFLDRIGERLASRQPSRAGP